MRKRLEAYAQGRRKATIVPWALVENDRPSATPVVERRWLFESASLALLYSGNFGRAHTWQGIPELAKRLRKAGGQVVFSVRGNALFQLQEAVQQAEAPIRFAEFASAEQLEARLSAADVHIVTLKEEWTGTVVPSKFFGALAIGRPVLFAGSRDSAVARWIDQFGVGWVLDPERIPELVEELISWGNCPESKARMFQHCFEVYMREFSQSKGLDEWGQQLSDLIKREAPNEL
jgi:glycosyltransferase involved in cell wall biosynthesis